MECVYMCYIIRGGPAHWTGLTLRSHHMSERVLWMSDPAHPVC